MLSEAYLLTGRSEEGLALTERALKIADARQRLRGEIAARRDSPETERAEHSYHEALALAAELGMRPLQAHCHVGLGGLCARSGRQEQARDHLSAAVDLYRAMQMTFWLPQVESALCR